MKKRKMALLGLLVISVIFFLGGTGCILLALRRPLINRNKETTALIPVLREDAQRFIDKLEIIRRGLLEDENRLMISLNKDEGICQIEILYRYHPKGAYFSEKLEEIAEEFTSEQIDAINYLFFSDELKLNALSINYNFGNGISSSFHTVFARSSDYSYALGIAYFDPYDPYYIQDLNYLRRWGDYVEELECNYWLVRWFIERL